MDQNIEETILVSICCITYNHEQYVAQAIESFLMQKVDFKFEILIHDDASTDRTADIIRSYEQKYPKVIKPIYETENQYSKGVDVDSFNWERVKGKYIAYCEGDDYWTDPLKLQKQVNFLEKHSEFSMCIHASSVINRNEAFIKEIRASHIDRYFVTEEIILGGGGFFATNSMMLRAKFIRELPKFYYDAPIGDYPLAIFFSLKGKVYYINDNMSVYRHMIEGSWSEKMSIDKEAVSKSTEKKICMLNEINEYTGYKYEQAVQDVILRNRFCILKVNNEVKKMKQIEYSRLYKKLNRKQKLTCYLYSYLPLVMRVWRKVKGKMILLCK